MIGKAIVNQGLTKGGDKVSNYTNKPAFYRVGNRLINRYEVRDVLIQEPQPFGYPRAIVTYKDGTKVKVAGTRVPMFITWIQDQERPERPFGY